MTIAARLVALGAVLLAVWVSVLRPVAPVTGIGDRCPPVLPDARDGRGGFAPFAVRPPWFRQLLVHEPDLDDWAELCFYRDENARLAARGEQAEIVLFGDSFIEGWRRTSPGFFVPGRINRGIGGQTSAHLLVRIGADVIALEPDIVHILVGFNDVTGRGGPLRVEDYERNLRALVRLAKAEEITVVLGTIPPGGEASWAPGLDPVPIVARLNTVVARVAAEEGARLVDYHTALADESGRMRPGLAEDGIHPTRAGYAIMERVLGEALAAPRAPLEPR